MDGTTIMIPIPAAFTIVGLGVTTILWAFATFERKSDSQLKFTDLEERVSSQGKVLQEVAQNVSYIRGRLEPK